jgi:acyl-coenzyme A synthetase/AMP-(fatty) acid ligase
MDPYADLPGQPKPIVQTTSMASTLDIYTTLSKNGEMLTHDHMRGAQYLTTAPLCWVAGLVSIIHTPIFWDTVPVLLPDDAPMPLDVDLVKRVHRAVDFDGGFYPPSLLRDICEDAEALEHIKKLKFVMYAGAPLDEWVGDLLCKSVHVLPLIGSTEVGMLPLIQPKVDEDWKYYHFHPASGYRMEPRRDLFELIIDRKSELEPFQSVFKVFPELQTFSTKDLYRPHSEKPNLWKYEGRGDDLVKLSWLAKFHAKDIESAIERHPKVLSALMGGDDRPKPFLLVELKSREETSDLEDIWQELKAINKKNTEEIRIAKEMVLIADPHRSFRRSLKRTLDRKAILADYQKDIDMLYLCFNGEH